MVVNPYSQLQLEGSVLLGGSDGDLATEELQSLLGLLGWDDVEQRRYTIEEPFYL